MAVLKRENSPVALPLALDIAAIESLPRRRTAELLLEVASRDREFRERLIEALARPRPAGLPPEASLPAAGQGGGESYMIGSSTPMLEVFDRVRRYAAVDSPVLITGESGTGKELAAQAIHDHSRRANGPFVAINCAALPPSLVSSELFGHEKGAFTGAFERRTGHLELAHRGTLFLDEIGDLPLEIQGHLLRFLQDGQVLRLGARQPVPVDVRIVAATHVALAPAVARRDFREDLFYRLAVLTLEMPPLRARGADVELLATIFLKRIAAEGGHAVTGFTPEALARLQSYAWPGNVRQLIAVIRRAVVMCDGPRIGLTDLALEDPPAAAVAPRSTAEGRPLPGSSEEAARVRAALGAHGANVAAAARALGVSRVTLYRMIARNGIPLER